MLDSAEDIAGGTIALKDTAGEFIFTRKCALAQRVHRHHS
jgi:hypothetical protein